MLDRTLLDENAGYVALVSNADVLGDRRLFWAGKRLFDVTASLVLLVILIPLAGVILLLNPFLNRGKLFFVQKRMGRNCQPFLALKFRSMTEVAHITRACDDPIEQHRITRLGRFLRQTRLDELPQILNVLKGEMSLIGPRPDYYEHACAFKAAIPGYSERHMIRPPVFPVWHRWISATSREPTRPGQKWRKTFTTFATRGFDRKFGFSRRHLPPLSKWLERKKVRHLADI